MRAKTGVGVWPAPMALVATLFGVTPAQASEALVFAVAKLPLSMPIYVAEAKGYFSAEKLDLQIADCDIGRQCLDRMLKGQAQLATSADSPIVFASLSGAKFSILATMATMHNFSKIIARRGLGIASVADLQDRRVGTFVGTSAHYFLEMSLLTAGVDPVRVKIVPVESSSVGPSLASGAVDALAVFEPFASSVLNNQAQQVRMLPSNGVQTDTWNVVAAYALHGQRDAELQGLCRALDKAIQFIAESPEEARAILRRRLALDTPTVDGVLKDIDFELELRQSLITGLEGQARWAVRGGLATGKTPNFLEYLRPEPLKHVRAGAVSIVR
ncbi:ABC transporter substrate-binding protein [Ideonella sp.]|uniref:ABC transporter substrate-binding protein n=1 Tax=Ideonella sp. TaxID=1929293 RepID=UPI0035B048F0